MATSREPFEPECWYHIFNHARGNDTLFESEFEYLTFRKLIEKYIVPVAETYAYCLMPNHFHFLIRFKEIVLSEDISFENKSDFFAHHWGNVQNTYSKKKNFTTGNRGGLFCQSINRNLITSEEYLQMCIAYIHNNPVKHGFCVSPIEWQYSSYNSILAIGETKVERKEVLQWFENRDNFIQYHNTNAADMFAEKFKVR